MNSPVENLRDQSAKRLLQGMKTILAWQTSCRNLFKEAQQFQNDQFKWQLSRFCYKYEVLNPYVLQINEVGPLLEELRGPDATLLDRKFVDKIINRAGTAKVHAEPALMHYISTVQVSLQYVVLVFFTFRFPFAGQSI